MRILTAVISLGRILFGTVFIAEPKVMDQGWIGKQARLPGAQVLTRAVGAVVSPITTWLNAAATLAAVLTRPKP